VTADANEIVYFICFVESIKSTCARKGGRHGYPWNLRPPRVAMNLCLRDFGVYGGGLHGMGYDMPLELAFDEQQVCKFARSLRWMIYR